MKKLLTVLAMVAMTGVLAHADDSKGTEFKFGGEMLQRFTYDNNFQFANSGGLQQQDWLQRDQFHVNAIASDKLQAYINLLNYFQWGGTSGVPTNPAALGTNGTPNNTATVGLYNTVQVSEAWLWWKVSDQFSLRAGRQIIDYGDGLEFSKNDWNMNPYNTEGLMGRFSWDFMDLDLGGGVLSDGGVPVAGSTTDTETVFYGLYGSFKNLPDFLKKADIFLLQINADPNGATVGAFGPFAPSMSGATNWNLTSYGIHVKGDASMIDYRVDGVLQNGTQKAAAGGTNTTFGGNMIDVEVGANWADFMKARLYVDYHMDSGAGSSANTNNRYQPLFYDQHDFAGRMDVFGFGNLTDIRFGLTLEPMEDSKVGVECNILSRTSTTDTASLQGSNTGFNNAYTGSTFNPGVGEGAAGSDSSLGTEIDLWASHDYGHGFSMLADAGFLSLGQYYKSGGASPGSAFELQAQAKYAF